jgi:hypothetical protein
MEENYVYRMYQTMSSGTLTPVKYYRKVTPGQRKASKEEREAFTAAAAAQYAAANGIELAAVKRDKVMIMGGRPTRGAEI